MSHTNHRRLTSDDVAEQLRVDPYTVRKWANSGALRGSKPSRHWLFTQDDVDAFVEAHANRAPERRRRRRAA